MPMRRADEYPLKLYDQLPALKVESGIRCFNEARPVILRSLVSAGRGEEIRVLTLPNGDRVFADHITRLAGNRNDNDRWTISLRDKATKDVLCKLLPLYLLLIESDGSLRYVIRYDESFPTYQKGGFPEALLYLLEAGWYASVGDERVIKCS